MRVPKIDSSDSHFDGDTGHETDHVEMRRGRRRVDGKQLHINAELVDIAQFLLRARAGARNAMARIRLQHKHAGTR